MDLSSILGGAIGGAGAGTSISPGWGTAIGGVAGGIMGMFGGGSKKKDDPLAAIRNQLMGLASGVPDLVNRRKEQIGELYGEKETTGLRDIREDTRGTRGFGASSIESRLQNELRGSLARGQSQEELAADQWGLTSQANILGQAGSMPFPGEEASPWGGVAQLGGQLLGQGMTDKSNESLYKDLLGNKETPQATQDLYSGLDIDKRGAALKSGPEAIGSNIGYRKY